MIDIKKLKLSKHLKLTLYAVKYFNYYWKTRRLLNDNIWNDSEKIRQYQLNKLKDIIEYSYNYVPYYKELFNKINFSPADFNNLNDITKIPFLTKDLIRDNRDKLISEVFPRKYLKTEKTSGTSGDHLEFFLDERTSSPVEMAFLAHMWEKLGYKLYDKCIVMRGEKLKNIIEGKKYWKINITINWLSMSAFYLNNNTFPLYYKKFISFNPRYIITYPSNAYILARYFQEFNKRPGPSLKAIICSSENLFDWQRKYIEDVFKIKVYNYYGLSEKCAIASECGDSNILEFYPQYGFVELINNKNEWCTQEDEEGEIVATGFNNYASPLIRYRTGDIGVYTTCQTNDHPGWLAVKRIEGRKQNYIIDKNNAIKTAIHLNRPFWDVSETIYAYQYIQNIPGSMILKIHAKEKLNDLQVDEIRKIFDSFYPNFELQINQVSDIPRSKSGKFKYLIQNLSI
jgi:phenylacetate-CoA ligase